jgi:hypothetical protein
MACDVRTSPFKLEASNVTYGAESVYCVSAVTGLTGGESFHMSSPAQDYYVYMTVDGAGADPAPAGRLPILVALPVAYTVADFNSAFVTAVEAIQESGDNVFRAKVSSDALSVSVETVDVGAPLLALADVDSGFTLETDKEGFSEALGKTSEAITVSFSSSELTVTSDQTGAETALDVIITGTGATLSASFIELSEDKLDAIIAKGYGDSYTPTSGTKLLGFGTSKNFQSALDIGGRLILHPLRLAATDRSSDVVFHKTLPKPSEINYSGTDIQALSVEFTAIIDETKRPEINIYSIGDWKQDIRA